VDFLFFVRANLTMKVSFSVMNTLKDLDNLLKLFLDALQMVVYSNNKFLYKIYVRKIPVYHINDEGTVIEVKALLVPPVPF
jgi:Holliday junction resolvase RusA-like endonuclease